MNVRTDLALAYMMGYDDAMAKRMLDSSKAGILNSYNCTNSERTTTVDETERIKCRYVSGLHDRFLTVHVMECSACGHTYEHVNGDYEHVNGDYEYCPHCGARIVEVNG